MMGILVPVLRLTAGVVAVRLGVTFLHAGCPGYIFRVDGPIARREPSRGVAGRRRADMLLPGSVSKPQLLIVELRSL